jgi:hypothetical protein
MFRASSMFSIVLSVSQRLNDWKMKPTDVRAFVRSVSLSEVMSRPSTVTEPEVGLEEPPSIVRSVVLPDRMGP